ncbi:ABC transporter ATP-binding protein [Phreatobacter sp. AB_2022a]|uniref:ABC transporter ATP-binding protein n=1 Tax=Phreatobacter sp. AB_2022a TaxID=3003134 RepID=UPI00228711D5|nr:oligopeptide/dipeptide ABC transporter ATP-binding protein [Phreatobacter sp. AB_2022a]MCZ0733195.1 ATP-binding cassette domain-containing protein [Phreatobacter sp. AB_2022a]
MSLLSVRELSVAFPSARGVVRAVTDVSLTVGPGETVALVGESGCGKSSLGKAIMRLAPIAAGTVSIEGTDITTLGPRALRPFRPRVQMIFQDPYSSLNPRHTVGEIIGQPLAVAGRPRAEIRERVAAVMARVGLAADAAARYPHEFSGGQRQRVGIARALVLNPKVVICDEPVSALDVSVRAQVINLLRDLQQDFGVSYLFISHDLSVVEHVADRVLVMYLGRVVESGPAAEIFASPAHPYTRALIEAAPVANPRLARTRSRTILGGELPSPLKPPAGCAFHARCPFAQAVCRERAPRLEPGASGRAVACHFPLLPPIGAAALADRLDA